MISIEELYSSADLGSITHDFNLNLQQLHYRMNVIRHLWNQPMIVTSGFRTPEEQIKIYAAKGQPAKLGSLHLIGAACDISDPQGDLKKWTLDHLQLMEELNLYMEDFDSTGGSNCGWIHFQLYAPQSGSRFFLP